MAHAITLKSNLGDSLLFASMTATESLGRLFTYEVEAISRSAEIDLRALLGTTALIKLVSPQGYTRYFNGMVSECEQSGFVNIESLRYAVYRLTLVPKPWLLTRRRDCRIFRGMSVPQIIRCVLAEIGYEDLSLSLSGDYPAREFCVQYRESCFDFISRLMEQEGIYYFFTHSESTHTMVLADALAAHSKVAGFERIPYAPSMGKGKRVKAAVTDWETARTINATKVQLDDYDYLKPRASLLVAQALTDAADAHDVDGLDIYDWTYDQVGYDGRVSDGQRYAQVRTDALNVAQAVHAGCTDACGIAAGTLFRLTDFPLASANQEYLVIETAMRLVEPDYVSGGGGGDDGEEPFLCSFKVIKSRRPFRTMPVTPRPTIAGLQTAVVCGDAPENISVDKYGRVQVTFFWSRPGKPNAENSCPVRVAQMWAGKRWGAQFIPRVGQEVVVSFLDGNPDRPLIIGSVYNADNMPPYGLPGNKTQSGVRSRSHEGGSGDYNEIRFEDRKGGEQVLLHAQKDLREESGHDHDVQVEHNYTLTAGNQIKLVSGRASITMNSSGEIAIKGTRITLNGDLSVTMSSGLAMEINAKTNLNVSSSAAIQILSQANCLVQSTNLQLMGTATAVLGGGAAMLL
ncbi:type VI secretion system Vgr family protein [Paraburkholderia caffeinilytica]|uniref:type VI secretion system Vgr family protein n=1 Tax=Paraburkholderia caffeinilytica TaxID=1761016 RepID=UPI0038BD23E8